MVCISGTHDTQLSDTAHGVLYGCFAIMGFFAGSVNNILWASSNLFLGTTGYSSTSAPSGRSRYMVPGGSSFSPARFLALVGLSCFLYPFPSSFFPPNPLSPRVGRNALMLMEMFHSGRSSLVCTRRYHDVVPP